MTLQGPVPCPFCDRDVGASPLSAHSCSHCGRELIVCERYRIVELLGRGGMGAVYGATDESGHKVAAKVLTLKTANDWTAWELFQRSSHVLMQLEHPGLPKVYAFAQDKPARLILVREAFDGGSLAERVKSDRRISPTVLNDLTVSLLEILTYLQSLVPPVIHRDIKPANIMFRSPESWEPVLADFDTIAAPESQRTGLTIVGTIGYAAPEQFSGESTPSSDLFGLGATLLNVITHTEPDRMRRQDGQLVLGNALDGLDATLARVLRRMVELDPRDRFADARAALAALLAPDPPNVADVVEPPFESNLPSPLPAEASTEPNEFEAVVKPRPRRWGSLFTLLAIALPIATILINVMPLLQQAWAGVPYSPARQSGTAKYSNPRTMLRETKACADGDGNECYRAGVSYVIGDYADIDLGQALLYYGYACDRKSAKGCINLGNLYLRGKGVVKDLSVAHGYFLKACELKSSYGCSLACLDFFHGEGVAANPAAAFDYCTRSCNEKYATPKDDEGCTTLGILYAAGIGTGRDYFQAAAILSTECNLVPRACMALAELADKGQGVAQDSARAFNLRYRACKQQLAGGCDAVKAAYLANRSETLQLLSASCTNADAFACDEIKRLKAIP